MMPAAGPHPPPAPLSANAQHLLALKEKIFNVWKERVRERVQQARVLQEPILVDTLPAFFNNIVASVDAGQARTSAVEGTTMATEHGGERARITTYSHAALIEEYQIFRWAIFNVLHEEHVVLDLTEMHAVNASIDAGIQQAVEGYSLIQSGFRERFAAALTHDLRGPLAGTAMGLELILATTDPQVVKKVAAKSLANVRRMAGMIDELLHTMAFHGGEALQLDMSDVDIAELVQEVHGDAALLHGDRFVIDGQPIRGHWDRAALKRALENLVGNAVKYGSPDTPITIRTERVNDRLVISVHNEGAPIPPAEQECIFQMYRRAELARDAAQPGWGIGLQYVRAVAESHGGSVGLDTDLARGTIFFIDIPLDGRIAAGAPTLAAAG
jgi:signal transduction histidine kinase